MYTYVVAVVVAAAAVGGGGYAEVDIDIFAAVAAFLLAFLSFMHDIVCCLLLFPYLFKKGSKL